MPVFKRDDAEIHYDVYGSGHTILLFAPGGMRSRMELWRPQADGTPRPWNDWIDVLSKTYRVVAMDQRNAGSSVGDIKADHGWHTYAGDHLALMDHVGAETFHTLGGCIGSSFCLKLCEIAPERVTAAVLQNPIGVHPVHSNYFPDAFAEWTEEQRLARGELDDAAVAAFGKNMFDHDFVFCVDRDFARRCTTPTLLMPGDDVPHPAATAAELKELLPETEYLADWKGPTHIVAQRDAVLAFLEKHTP